MRLRLRLEEEQAQVDRDEVCRPTRNVEERSVTASLTKERENMNDTDKKRWSTPKLRIFARMKAEERVLDGCKLVTTRHGGSDNMNYRCLSHTCTPSFPCRAITGS